MTATTTSIVVWIIAGLLAFAFLGSGITKLLGVEMQIKNLESWGYPLWMRFPIGLSEVGFSIGLLILAYRKWVVYGIFGWGLWLYTPILKPLATIWNAWRSGYISGFSYWLVFYDQKDNFKINHLL